MGWGRKTTGAKPQPLPAPKNQDEDVTHDTAPHVTARVAVVAGCSRPAREEAGGVAKEESAVESGAPASTVEQRPSNAAKAEMAWAQLKSKKGWVPETVAMVLYEFVKDRALFDDLVKFAKRRR